MKREDWKVEKPRLLAALGKMETWAAMLLQSVEETKAEVEAADDDSIFQPESHPVGVPYFEMVMRDADSVLREVLAAHQAIQQHYRDNQTVLNTGKLLDKPDFTPEEVAEVMQLVQGALSQDKDNAASPVVFVVDKDKIQLQIEPDK